MLNRVHTFGVITNIQYCVQLKSSRVVSFRGSQRQTVLLTVTPCLSTVIGRFIYAREE